MKTYDLYLESGPRRKKTMVHVLALLGCVATGPTTDEAVAAAPEAIAAFVRFLARHGEAVDPVAPFGTHVAQHVTEGQWLGNGSPYLVFEPDLEPVTAEEIELFATRFHWLREELAAWAAVQSEAQLDVKPDGGRPVRAVLLHIMGGPGGYLSAILGGSTGFAATAGAAERGDLSLLDGLRRIDAMTSERLRAATVEQRAAVLHRPNGTIATLRKAIRRTLEHDWEHLAELARRPGGPEL